MAANIDYLKGQGPPSFLVRLATNMSGVTAKTGFGVPGMKFRPVGLPHQEPYVFSRRLQCMAELVALHDLLIPNSRDATVEEIEASNKVLRSKTVEIIQF